MVHMPHRHSHHANQLHCITSIASHRHRMSVRGHQEAWACMLRAILGPSNSLSILFMWTQRLFLPFLLSKPHHNFIPPSFVRDIRLCRRASVLRICSHLHPVNSIVCHLLPFNSAVWLRLTSVRNSTAAFSRSQTRQQCRRLCRCRRLEATPHQCHRLCRGASSRQNGKGQVPLTQVLLLSAVLLMFFRIARNATVLLHWVSPSAHFAFRQRHCRRALAS